MTEPMEMEIYLGNGDADFSDIVLEPISWPLESQLTPEWVESLMGGGGVLNQFTWKNSVSSEFPSTLPYSVAVSLVDCAAQILDREANCVRINCCGEKNSRVIVVGDLHGQLHDILKIDQPGRPSQNQWFVFNGNYIGRGSWSLEVFLVLLAWNILMPERVFLLRGSSETIISAEELGFLKETCDRYADEQGPVLYSKCIDCFKALPLASVISDSVYTTSWRSLSKLLSGP